MLKSWNCRWFVLFGTHLICLFHSSLSSAVYNCLLHFIHPVYVAESVANRPHPSPFTPSSRLLTRSLSTNLYAGDRGLPEHWFVMKPWCKNDFYILTSYNSSLCAWGYWSCQWERPLRNWKILHRYPSVLEVQHGPTFTSKSLVLWQPLFPDPQKDREKCILWTARGSVSKPGHQRLSFLTFPTDWWKEQVRELNEK